ncbi:MAG: heme biosynthesis HemY N-terminal domain-containing protein [Woeseiaceae bacterium]
MKAGLIIVLAILVSMFAASFLMQDPGYVGINFRGYLIEMSVPTLVILIIFLIVAIWLVRVIWLAPRRMGEAAGRYRAGRAGQKLTRGMIEVAEGNFARGEKLLARAASTSDSPLFNYLQAARAAHLQGLDERRDEWLKIAFEETPEAANAVLLTQAEFQLDRGQHESALATLKRLEENSRDHSYALALLGRLYFKLQDWSALAEILPRLKKHGRVDAKTLETWTVRVHEEALDSAADIEFLEASWKAVPKPLKKNITLLEARYTGLMRCDLHDKAEKEIAAALKSEWQSPLVRLFGIVKGPNASKQLKQAETWLAKHPEDPELILTAARLCLRNELWGKARSYLETVISLRPTPEAYHEYGRLLTQLGEGEAAADAYKAGLGMVTDEPLPAIPHLDADFK